MVRFYMDLVIFVTQSSLIKAMKKILCPTDFSETANSGVVYAAKLAKATGCILTLLHVRSVFDYAFPELNDGPIVSTDEITAQLEAQSREISQTFKISCYA